MELMEGSWDEGRRKSSLCIERNTMSGQARFELPFWCTIASRCINTPSNLLLWIIRCIMHVDSQSAC